MPYTCLFAYTPLNKKVKPLKHPLIKEHQDIIEQI